MKEAFSSVIDEGFSGGCDSGGCHLGVERGLVVVGGEGV